MLEVATEREVEGDLCLHDLGHGLPLRRDAFDGAISISAVCSRSKVSLKMSNKSKWSKLQFVCCLLFLRVILK